MKYVCWVATRTPRGIDVKTKRRSLIARAEKKEIVLVIFLEQAAFELCFCWFVKGQLISKCLFGVFNFLQKTNENKST